MRIIVATFTAMLLGASALQAQTPESRPAPMTSDAGRSQPQAGQPGPTDAATGMSRRENYDAQLNSSATDNSTGTPTGSDEQKTR